MGIWGIPLEWVMGGAVALLAVLVYAGARISRRRRWRRELRRPRSFRTRMLAEWAQREWLDPEGADLLPKESTAAALLYEWAWVDRDAAARWRLPRSLTPEASLETVAQEAWNSLPTATQESSRERLIAAVREASTWWGGAERGWNRRPLALLAAAVTKKQAGLPLLPVEDLTAAPLAGPVRAERMAEAASGPELVLALALLRKSRPEWSHPLAPTADSATSMVAGLSTRVGSDVGRRVGAGLGAALGPIGSMVGQYLGEMAGRLGGEALAAKALPEQIAGALGETEDALGRLGESSASEAFARAARLPSEEVLECGKRLERVRATRARALPERIWPTPGQTAVEEAMRVAVGELAGYRDAAEHFLKSARNAPPAVAGGMILQNPWMVRELPGGVERLNAARSTLNRAAQAIRRSRPRR